LKNWKMNLSFILKYNRSYHCYVSAFFPIRWFLPEELRYCVAFIDLKSIIYKL